MGKIGGGRYLIYHRITEIPAVLITPLIPFDNLRLVEHKYGFFTNKIGLRKIQFFLHRKSLTDLIFWIEKGNFLEKKLKAKITPFQIFLVGLNTLRCARYDQKAWWDLKELQRVFPIFFENIEAETKDDDFQNLCVSYDLKKAILIKHERVIHFLNLKEMTSENRKVQFFLNLVAEGVKNGDELEPDLYSELEKQNGDYYLEFLENNPIPRIKKDGEFWWIQSSLIKTLQFSQELVVKYLTKEHRKKLSFYEIKHVMVNPARQGCFGINAEGLQIIAEHSNKLKVKNIIKTLLKQAEKDSENTS